MATVTRAMKMGQADRELSMYGCSIADFKDSVEDSITFKLTGPAMCIASLMSDAQEEMSYGMLDQARQTMNKAKWMLATYLMQR